MRVSSEIKIVAYSHFLISFLKKAKQALSFSNPQTQCFYDMKSLEFKYQSYQQYVKIEAILTIVTILIGIKYNFTSFYFIGLIILGMLLLLSLYKIFQRSQNKVKYSNKNIDEKKMSFFGRYEDKMIGWILVGIGLIDLGLVRVSIDDLFYDGISFSLNISMMMIICRLHIDSFGMLGVSYLVNFFVLFMILNNYSSIFFLQYWVFYTICSGICIWICFDSEYEKRKHFEMKWKYKRQCQLMKEFLENMNDPLIVFQESGIVFQNQAAEVFNFRNPTFREQLQLIISEEGEVLADSIKSHFLEDSKEDSPNSSNSIKSDSNPDLPMNHILEKIYYYQSIDAEIIKPNKILKVKLLNNEFFQESSPTIGLILRDITAARAMEANRINEKYKNILICSLPHELLTPLNGIQGPLSMLKKQLKEAQQKDSSNYKNKSIHHLMKVVMASSFILNCKIHDLLDYSQMMEDDVNLKWSFINLRKYVKHIIKIYTILADNKPIEINAKMDEGLPEEIEVDEDRLNQVISTLMSNALKHTDNGYIYLKAATTKEQDSIRFIVEDTGRGMNEKQKSLLFKIKEEKDVTSLPGLGLTICQIICSKFGAEILVKSKLGKGSEFSFCLPISSSSQAQTKLIVKGEESKRVRSSQSTSSVVNTSIKYLKTFVRKPIGNKIVDHTRAGNTENSIPISKEHSDSKVKPRINTLNNPNINSYGLEEIKEAEEDTLRRNKTNKQNHIDQGNRKPSASHLSKKLSSNNLKKEKKRKETTVIQGKPQLLPNLRDYSIPTVIIVDDHDINRYVLRNLLKKYNLAIEEASNGLEAINLCQKQVITRNTKILIFMDIEMPVKNGIEATKHIRRVRFARQPVIVALTAYSSKKQRDLCFKVGMNGFLNKPITPKKIEEAFKLLNSSS